MKILTVKLQYFKPSGKWYESGEFEVPDTMELYQIWEFVRLKALNGNLPGLANSVTPYEYMITVDVPGHKNEHPHIMMPR